MASGHLSTTFAVLCVLLPGSRANALCVTFAAAVPGLINNGTATDDSGLKTRWVTAAGRRDVGGCQEGPGPCNGLAGTGRR